MRVVLSPIFWGLLIGSMGVNAWILINFSGQRAIVEKSVKAWEDLGLPVDENTAEQYLEVLEPGEKKEAGIPTLRQIMDGTVYMTNELDSSVLAENFSSALMLEDGAKKYAEKEYQKMEGILAENRRNQDAAHFFVPGSRGFFEYTSKTGRKSQDQRRRAAILAGLTFTAVIWGVTILAAALIFPLGPLWKTPIGSMMVLDSYFPVISWFPLHIAGYLGLEFLISVCAAVLFSYIGYTFAAKGRNSFKAFILLGFGCACIYTVTSLFPKWSVVYFILQYNPVDLARKAGHWMVNGASFLSPRYYEITVIILWGILIACAAFRVRRQFLKKDL